MSQKKKSPSQRPGHPGPDPGPPAGPGLKRWLENNAKYFRSFHREATRLGWPADIIVSSTPMDDRTDTPPSHFSPIPRVNRGILTRAVPQLRGTFDRPAQDGYFYVLATKGSGRLKGSFVAALPIPSADDSLPELGLTVPPPPPLHTLC